MPVRALRLLAQSSAEKEVRVTIGQPFENIGFFELLGLKLNGGWTFGGHVTESPKELHARTAVLYKLSNSRRGMEGRTLAITAHALMGSLISRGLPVTGSAAATADMGKIDIRILNPYAGRSCTHWQISAQPITVIF